MSVTWTPGRAWYLLYHAPRAAVRESIGRGGPWEQWRDARGAAAMRAVAWALDPPPDFPGPPIEVHQLTGCRYAWQSLFALASLAHAARQPVAPHFYDDGTLASWQADHLRRVFPRAKIESHVTTLRRVDELLPVHLYPALRDRFLHYPHIRKLISPRLGRPGWKLVLDADLLFFRRPDLVLDWLAAPTAPLHLVDVADAYGYPRATLEQLAGAPLPARLNVGLCGLRGEAIDWARLETWCATLLAKHGTHYLLEQALTAMLVAGGPTVVAPGHAYQVLPGPDECRRPRAVLHHYVDSSRRGYYRHAWRVARALMGGEPVGAQPGLDHDWHAQLR